MTTEYSKSSQFRDDLFFENRRADEWMSTSEAASYLRITPNALRILVCRRRVKFFKLGRCLRFSTGDLNHLLTKGV